MNNEIEFIIKHHEDHTDASTVESEKSYDPLITSEELIDLIVFATFNPFWVCISTCANLLLFCLFTYREIFDEHFVRYGFIICLRGLSNFIIFIDIVCAFLHCYWKEIQIRRVYHPRYKARAHEQYAEYSSKPIHHRIFANLITALLFLDVLAITSMPIGHISSISWPFRVVQYICIMFRNYRIINALYLMSSSPGRNTQAYLLMKHGIVFILIIHSFSCIWMAIGCYKCENDTTWTKSDTYLHNPRSHPTTINIYILCILHVVGGFTSASVGGSTSSNDSEKAVLIWLMILSLVYLNGLFLGTFTSVQIESYRRQTMFTTKLKLILGNLQRHKVPKLLIGKMTLYFIRFWKEEDGIKDSQLFHNLPFSIRKQVLLDKYWHSFSQSRLLKNLGDSCKRAIAKHISIRICIPGDVIYEMHQEKASIVYIAKGGAHILSTIDAESPLLTLGVGSCLGEVSLAYSTPSTTKVMAASYCTIYELHKTDLWKVILNHRKIKQGQILHNSVQHLITQARANRQQAAEQEFRVDEKQKLLQKIKHSLRTEEDLDLTFRFGEFKHENDRLFDPYILSKERMTYSDDVFLQTIWPWIFKPHSKFLDSWEILVVIIVSVACLEYPVSIAYVRQDFTGLFNIYRVIVHLVYWIDVLMQLFTAVETTDGLQSSLLNILIVRLASLAFLLDCFAIFPLYSACYFCGLHEERILMILTANKLLKIGKVAIPSSNKVGSNEDGKYQGAKYHSLTTLKIMYVKYQGKCVKWHTCRTFASTITPFLEPEILVIREWHLAEFNHRLNIAYVRLFKYVLYLIYPAYIIGALYYMVACFEEECYDNMSLKQITTGSRFWHSILMAMLIISGTGGSVPFINFMEVTLIMGCSLIGSLIFLYLIADYSATLILADMQRVTYFEMIGVMRKFMATNNMVKHIQYRMNEYMIARWLDYKGIDPKELYSDVPKPLLEELKFRKYGRFLITNPLFQVLNQQTIRRLSVSCSSVSLPVNEFVTYAGELSRNVFIIEKGFCEITSSSTEKVEKVLGPMSSFCVVETLLEVAGIFNIRTITHTTLVTLNLKQINEAFFDQPEISAPLKELIENIKDSFAAKRLFTQTATVKPYVIEEKEESWFVFPRSVIHPRNIDYLQGWSKWTLFKYLTLRRTILPHGKFILIWEIVRACFAYMSAILYPTAHVYACYLKSFDYYLIILDVFGLVDIYIRLHVGYYNNMGVLVTHPRCTAVNYLTSSFIIDLLGIIPLDYGVYIIQHIDDANFYFYQSFIRLNKLLQIYRIPDAFSYFSRDALKLSSVLKNALRFLPLTLVLLNTLAAITLNFSVNFSKLPNGLKKLEPVPSSWITASASTFTFDINEPFHTYILSYYWVTTSALQLSFGNIQTDINTDVLFLIVVIVLGYLWFTYVTVIVSTSRATIDNHLNLYQKHMRHLIRFMKIKKIRKELQEEAINYFEYKWQRTHGMDANMILAECHLALRKDCALYLYQKTLQRIPIFNDMPSVFYRSFGIEVNENYYLKNYPIIQLNDIVKSVYILHKGSATVIGPDGSRIDVLMRGSMFGNLDDVNCIRSMVTIVSNTNVDLLTIGTKHMYELFRNYPVIKNRLQKHLLLKNYSYIAITLEDQEKDSKLYIKLLAKKTRRYFSIWGQIVFMLFSLLSSIVVSYQIAFKDYSIYFFVVSYALDGIGIAKIVYEFIYPLQTDETDVKIRVTKKYFLKRLLLEVLATIPIEIACLFWSYENQFTALAWFKANRLLRLIPVIKFLTSRYNLLNINVIAIKLLSIFIVIVIAVHAEACIWYMVGCPPGQECNPLGWMYLDDKMICKNHYLCALYFTMSITSASGYMNAKAKSLTELILTIVITIVNKYMIAVIIGDMSAIAQISSSALTNYDFNRTQMKLFLKNSFVSMPLFDNAMNYTSQLWMRNRGLQVPIFLTQAPAYLSAAIKNEAFGHHIRENLLFKSCHPDFLRLIIKQTKVERYFSGDIICQQGDINGTMYFIYNGKVDVFYLTETEEIHVDSLITDDCFGMIQGLFPGAPHTHTFKAITVTVMLTLKMEKWVHLLDFYPASKYVIYDKLSQI